MAKLEVSIDLLSNLLFCDAFASITDVVEVNKRTKIITFEIEGADVPEVEQVYAEVRQYKRTVKFSPTTKV